MPLQVPPVTNAHEVAHTDHSITVGWTAPVLPTGESLEGTLCDSATDPSIVDSQGTTWALSTNNKILINGVADTRTGSAVVEILFYHLHQVFQQNSKGTWYYTANQADSWHQTSPGPIVTHWTVLAELATFKSSLMRLNNSQIQQYNQIVTDVGKLLP